jgi:HTH-type transcriptional regulator, transcriptional repressor of NAD biosynthesis genes
VEQRFSTGLIVGRFDPPHLGHSYMIEQAAQQVDQLVVYVNWSTQRDTIPGELRATWLTDLHPSVEIRAVAHQLGTDFDDDELWEKWMALFRAHWPLDDGPHAVFSSDSYVSGLAERFGAQAVAVDPERAAVPISATQIRDQPAEHLDKVAEPVRAWIESNWLL